MVQGNRRFQRTIGKGIQQSSNLIAVSRMKKLETRPPRKLRLLSGIAWMGVAAGVAITLVSVRAASTRTWRLNPLEVYMLEHPPFDHSAIPESALSINPGSPVVETPYKARLRAVPREALTPETRLLVAASLGEPIDLEAALAGTNLPESDRVNAEFLAESLELELRLPQMTPAEQEYFRRTESVRYAIHVERLTQLWKQESETVSPNATPDRVSK